MMGCSGCIGRGSSRCETSGANAQGCWICGLVEIVRKWPAGQLVVERCRRGTQELSRSRSAEPCVTFSIRSPAVFRRVDTHTREEF